MSKVVVYLDLTGLSHVERGGSFGEVVAAQCKWYSFMLGVTDGVRRVLQELPGTVLARRGEIVSRAISIVMGNREVAERLRKAGLDEASVKRLSEDWLALVFQGGCDKQHCLEAARFGLVLVEGASRRAISQT